MSANQSTNNNKYDPEIMRKNGQLYRDPHSPKEERIREHKTDMSPRKKVEDHHQQKYASPSSLVPAFKNNQQEVIAAQVKVPLKNTSQGVYMFFITCIQFNRLDGIADFQLMKIECWICR